jgi:hypothetical protein
MVVHYASGPVKVATGVGRPATAPLLYNLVAGPGKEKSPVAAESATLGIPAAPWPERFLAGSAFSLKKPFQFSRTRLTMIQEA